MERIQLSRNNFDLNLKKVIYLYADRHAFSI